MYLIHWSRSSNHHSFGQIQYQSKNHFGHQDMMLVLEVYNASSGAVRRGEMYKIDDDICTIEIK